MTSENVAFVAKGGGVTKHARKPAFHRFLGVKNVAKWRGFS